MTNSVQYAQLPADFTQSYNSQARVIRAADKQCLLLCVEYIMRNYYESHTAASLHLPAYQTHQKENEKASLLKWKQLSLACTFLNVSDVTETNNRAWRLPLPCFPVWRSKQFSHTALREGWVVVPSLSSTPKTQGTQIPGWHLTWLPLRVLICKEKMQDRCSLRASISVITR